MPYNSETSEYERRSTTVIDATPDGDTVAVAIDTKLDLAADDAVVDLNHHMTNGRHYPATSSADNSRFLKQSPAGVVSWANGIPFEDGVDETELAASTGSAMVGYGAGTVKDRLDAISASGGSSLVGFIADGTGATARTVQAKLRDFVSVKDFGAVGDGVTDDMDSFTAAGQNPGLSLIPRPTASYNLGGPVSSGPTSAFLPDPTTSWTDLTDSGAFKWKKSVVTGDADGCAIWRFADRVFVGEAATDFAGNTRSGDIGDSWLNSTTSEQNDYPRYLGVNARLLVIGGPYAYAGAVRGSDFDGNVIGFGSAAIADAPGYKSAWAFIAETQLEAGAWHTHGLEVASKNKSSDYKMTPNNQTAGAFGVWLAGGGDDAFGGAPTAPSTAGVVLLGNSQTWNTGIIMMRDSLTNGEAISLSSEGIGGEHRVTWYNAAGNQVFMIGSTATDTDLWKLNRTNNGLGVYKSNKQLFNVAGPSNAENGVSVYGAVAGGTPQLLATGVDTNIDLRLSPKGTGVVRFGAWASSSDAAINGYITIKDAAGTSRKLATIA